MTVRDQDVSHHQRDLDAVAKRFLLAFRQLRADVGDSSVVTGKHAVVSRHADGIAVLDVIHRHGLVIRLAHANDCAVQS